jgi:light-regulated signal transduction histidine kinase (bacteriophytochrome)/ActR/RegA family two-component response regulator
LAYRADEPLTVVHVSANIQSMLGREPLEVLGSSLLELFRPASHAFLRSLTQRSNLREVNPRRLELQDGRTVQAVVHRSAELFVLELEPNAESHEGFDPGLRSAIMQLQAARDVATLSRSAATAVRELTGFDRVMVYRFDADWNGRVVAESRRKDLEPFLGLHYPASDIPVQARRLYTQNWLRLIADVNYQPSPLIPELDRESGQPLDLSHAHLRSVSRIHIEYLKNMRVTASMSVSLVSDGRLLGLIACHHYSGPHLPGYSIRETAEYLGQALSWNISVLERADEAERGRRGRECEAELAHALMGAEDLVSALAVPCLVELADARGAAVVLHEGTRSVGETPDAESIAKLVAWLKASQQDVFATDQLSAVLPEAKAWEDVAAGLLAAPISAELGEYLLWFRPSTERTVNWAGDPRKEATQTPGEPLRLSPRGSFALWREQVKGRALPWEKWEVEAASNVRRLMLSGVRRRAADLRMLNERLVDADRAKDVFIATISHELRTPLNAISGWSKLLVSGGVAEDRWPHAMEVIARNSDTLARLVEDLLDVSRIVGGKLELEIQHVDLVALVNEVADSMQLSAQAKNIRFARDITREPAVVLGDATRIRQVVSNLLGNAIKFTPKGGAIELQLARSNSDVQFSVNDNGPGIDPQELPHVFVAFWQADGSARRRTTGLGLGLAIAKKLVELHGGRITASSAGLGRGARFEVTLPVAAAHKASAPAAKPNQSGPKQALNGMKLLVVEDETDSRDLLALVLRSAGAEVHPMTNAVEALQLLRRERFDAIISDVGLPGMDGMDMLRQLRAEGAKQHQPPAVALTAYTRAYDRTAALRAGFHAHVPKPVDPEELITVVETLVDRQSA